MAYAQGSVILAPATYKSGVRPYLVVSNRNRPFFGDRYTVAVITSTERKAAVELTADSLSEGELNDSLESGNLETFIKRMR
jgi:mRNA-degrading endonuclease toxin of MazEF toxin-antitoxin module